MPQTSIFEKSRLGGEDFEFFRSLIERLMRIGLTKSEAKAYLALLLLHEGKGESVARVSGIARQEAYRVLSNLEELELVDRIVANPTRFRSAPLQAALARLIEDRKRAFETKLSELQELKDEMVNRFHSLKCELKEESGYVFLIHGRRIFERELELMRDSKEKILLIAPAYDLVRLHHEGATALIRRINRGRRVNIICTGSLRSFEEVNRAYKIFDLKYLQSFAGHLLLVDGSRTVVKIEERKALETDEEMFAQLMEYVFEVLWRNASPMEELERRETNIVGGRNDALEPTTSYPVSSD